MEFSEKVLRKKIVEIGKRLYEKGFVTATDGNMSCRIDSERILITPSGVCKGVLTEQSLIVVNEKGDVIEGSKGHGKPSSEIKMHLLIYSMRPDVRAILHAHPPLLTAITLAKVPFNTSILPEAWVSVGSVPIASYATPSTEDLAESIKPFVSSHKAILLERHGSITMADDIEKAYFMLEKLEHTALVLLYTYLFTGRFPNPLSEKEREILKRIFGS